jgi:hypothetical protein
LGNIASLEQLDANLQRHLGHARVFDATATGAEAFTRAAANQLIRGELG